MKRRRRTHILILGSSELRKKLASEIRQTYAINNLQEPRTALVMTTLRETARKTLFHLGEVLVSEARVFVNGSMGIGLIAGTDEDAALDLAIIDAAFNAQVPQIGAWEHLLKHEEQEIHQRLAREDATLQLTKVSFESMDSGDLE